MPTQRISIYVTREVFTPMLVGLCAFTFLLIMGRLPGLAELVINQGVPAPEILLLFSYLLPSFLAITLPLSVLLGVLLGFGRLAGDSEFIALKSIGISIFSLARPILLFALFCTLGTAFLAHQLEPESKTAFRDHLVKIASQQLGAGITPGRFIDQFDDLVLYVGRQGRSKRQFKQIFISDQRSQPASNIFARSGTFLVGPEQHQMTLRLEDGRIHRLTPAAQGDYQTLSFTRYDIHLDLGNNNQPQQRSRSLGEHPSLDLLRLGPQQKEAQQRQRYAIEFHKRVSSSLTPLLFALIGIPLGLSPSRSGKGAGFASALATALSYYLLLNLGATLAERGSLPPFIALYLPALLFALTGCYLLYCSAVEKPLPLISQLRRIKWRIKHRDSDETH